MATKMFSISDLDVTKQSEAGFEFEVQDDSTGKGVGVYLTVIGAHAPAVQKFTSKKLNERRVFDEMNERRGKKGQVRKIEDDVEFGIELAAIRIVGWRGISDEFSQANAVQLCTVNPTIREQILKASEDLANFTKGSHKT